MKGNSLGVFSIDSRIAAVTCPTFEVDHVDHGHEVPCRNESREPGDPLDRLLDELLELDDRVEGGERGCVRGVHCSTSFIEESLWNRKTGSRPACAAAGH